jgi:hypothetical protein
MEEDMKMDAGLGASLDLEDEDFGADADGSADAEYPREPEAKTYRSRDADQPVQELEPYINGMAERIVFTDGRLTTTNPGWQAVLDALVEAGGPVAAGESEE